MSQPPPKKRLRLGKSDSDAFAVTDGDGDASIDRRPIFAQGEGKYQAQQCKNLIVKLNDSLDALESCADRSTLPNLLEDASIGILQLKVMQRQILQKARATQNFLSQLATTRDEQELTLQNLRYQKLLNESSIASSQSLLSTELNGLVRSATATRKAYNGNIAISGDGDETIMGSNEPTMEHDKEKTEEELLGSFLGGDPKNPAQRALIVARLNQEIANRQTLEGQLEKLRRDLVSGKDTLTAKQKLLQDFPHKLAEMEKASIPLQKFCQRSLDVTQKLGTQRRQRLDLSASLPKALYTLFYQLQSCLDIMAASMQVADADNAGPGGDSLPVADVSTTGTTNEPSSSSVMLKIPIPTISDGGGLSFRPKKIVTITFNYVDTADMVYAHCSTDYDMGDLISELFPGDKGEWTPHESEGQEATQTSLISSNNKNARPYQWCNYLAGLHVAPGEQSASKMHVSAKVVVKALMRRVRATATLYWILHGLSRKPHPIPVHLAMKPQFEVFGGNSGKLVKWIAVASDNNSTFNSASNIRIFEATLNDGDSSSPDRSLTVRVLINVARYPSVPPQFQITSTQSESVWGHQEGSLDSLQIGLTPLYNESLARLQNHVNRDVDRLVISSDETTYDWILAQQMAELAKGLGRDS